MREIELKARVVDKASFLERLRLKNVILSEPMTQRDQVFGLANVSGGETNSAPWLRIRTQTRNNEITQIFTLKKSVTNQLDSIEHETEIHDPVELAAIIKHLGFEPYSDLTKTRQKAKIGEVELCVDSIKDLGDFVEVEKLTSDDADYSKVAAELWAVLEELGVDKLQHVTDGYDVMMRKHLGLKE